MAQISFSGKRELRWLQEGECFITFIEADVAIADALWDQWVAASVAAPGKRHLLTTVGDIQPTKEQWRRATRAMRDAKIKTAVVTESRATSALAKAASWAGIDMQAFRWDQLIDGCEWLGLDATRRAAVRTAAFSQREAFGAVGSAVPTAPTARLFANSTLPAPTASARPPSRPAPSASPSGSRVGASASEPQRVTPMRPSPTATPGTASRTPMADAASRNLAQVRQTSEEIQAKLAEIQAKLRNRTRG
jgi:hypothetical protein